MSRPNLPTGLFSPVLLYAALMVLSLIPRLASAQAILLPTIELLIGKHKAQVEVASTDASRAYGLMYRQALPRDHGMLFVFDRPDVHCFWMKNTPLPLSIAFIGSDGTITDIARMQPRSEAPHCPSGPIRYAPGGRVGKQQRVSLPLIQVCLGGGSTCCEEAVLLKSGSHRCEGSIAPA